MQDKTYRQVRCYENCHHIVNDEKSRGEESKKRLNKQAHMPNQTPNCRPSMFSRKEELCHYADSVCSEKKSRSGLAGTIASNKMFSANFQKKSLAKRLDHSHTIEIASSSRINAIIKEQYNRNRGHYLLGRAKTGTIMNKLVQKQVSLISDSIIIQDLNDDAAPIKNGNYTPRAVFNFQPRLSTSIKRSLSLGFVFPESDATILCNLKKHLNFLQKEIESGCLGNTILEWKETDCSLLKEYSINRSLQFEVIALGLREMLGGCDKQKQFSQIQELLCDNAELIFKEVTKSKTDKKE